MVPYGRAIQQLDWWAARLEFGVDGTVWSGCWWRESDTAVGQHGMIEVKCP